MNVQTPIRSVTAAQAFARSLRRKGKTCDEVSEALAKRGYLSNKTNKPMTASGVSMLTRRKKSLRQPKPASERKQGGVSSPSSSHHLRLDLVRSIVAQRDKSAEDRLALIALVLE